MSEEYSREVLRRTVARVCQTIGWHGINSTPLEILAHVLEKYILSLGTRAHRYAEHHRRTDPDLDDLALAFADADVRLPELREYAKCVPPSPLPLAVPDFPLPRESRLDFLKPGSREVLTRPVHVHEHLPPMFPEREREPTPPVADTVEIVQNGVADGEPAEARGADAAPDARRDPFKRPVDPAGAPAAKRARPRADEDRHARELSSVMMTTSGFLSPAREGKLPEARTPVVVPDSLPDGDAGAPARADALASRSPLAAPPERLDRKSKRSRAPNGKIEKPRKRERAPKHPSARRLLVEGAAVATPAPPVPPARPRPVPAARGRPLEPPPPSGPPPREPPAPRPPAAVERPPPVAPAPDCRPPLGVVAVKEEADPEKLTSQPDRSKLNIFKKISTNKIKEEKNHDLAEERAPVDGAERAIPRAPVEDPPARRRPADAADAFRPDSAVDLTSKRVERPPASEEFDPLKKIKREPVDDLPRDLSRPKPAAAPPPAPAAVAVREKKERKRKERKIKEERVIKEYSKILKKSSEETANRKAPDPAAGPQAGFPYFPLVRGMIPNLPGLIPRPGLIPGGAFFPGLANGPALRGPLPRDAAPNPFAHAGAGLGAAFLPTGPGLVPPALAHGFGQPPRMQRPPNLPSFLRRPSLEVIPIDDDDDSRARQKRQFASPSLVVREKAKTNRPIVDGFLASDSTVVSAIKRNPSPKANPVIPVPPVKPDVTIKLNPPEPRPKPVEPRPPEPRPPPPLPAEPPGPSVPKEKDKSEKKKDKLHKKEKKDKEQKTKKKKDKKDKSKLEKKKEKLELKEKMKKEKREKKKEKLSASAEGLVPKLTLKLGSASPTTPASPDSSKKLIIKPVVKKEEPTSPARVPRTPEEKSPAEPNQSPELARISALVTRPPKAKSSGRRGSSSRLEPNAEGDPVGSPPGGSSPRRSRPPSTVPKYKRIYFKPMAKRNSDDFDDSIVDLASDETATSESVPERIPDVPLGTPYYINQHGDKVWICPACGKPDNGSPMIACDGACDGWYHWVCVGIHVEPGDSEDWYCTSCIAKRRAMASAVAAGQTAKKRGRKPKLDKLKDNR